MTSKQKVFDIYPQAEVLHRTILGLRIYAVVRDRHSGYSIGEGTSASKAWVAAAKNIASGKLELSSLY